MQNIFRSEVKRMLTTLGISGEASLHGDLFIPKLLSYKSHFLCLMTVCYTLFNRDGFNSDDEQNGSKLFGESSPQDKQVTQGKPAILIKKNAG